MCEVLDKIETRGIEKGLQQGMQQGMQQGLQEGELKAKREMTRSLAGMGMPAERIAQAAKVDVEVVRQWLAQDAPAGD